MSFPQDSRRRRGGAGSGFSSTGRRTAMGYWIPLALTVGVATLSIAAWIWSERDEDDEDDRPHDGRDGHYPPPPPGTVDSSYPPPSYDTEDYARGTGTGAAPGDNPYDPSFMGRMQGALRRTPSPQQLFDGASRRVMAGVTAAGAYVGGALTSIREENRGDFEDHTRWSEEAQSRATQSDQQTAAAPTMTGALPGRTPAAGQNPFEKKKKTVAIVVSSLTPPDSDEFASEHAVSLPSYLVP